LEAIVNLNHWKIATVILANYFVHCAFRQSCKKASKLNLKGLNFLETFSAFLMPFSAFLGISAALVLF
jgi:hypothetical protein